VRRLWRWWKRPKNKNLSVVVPTTFHIHLGEPF